MRSGRVRVAVIDERVVGFATVDTDGDVIELEDLFVDPDWMRLGVGRALVDDCVGRARATSVRRIGVNANDHAAGFYEQIGFVAGERVALEHGDASRMTRHLPKPGA